MSVFKNTPLDKVILELEKVYKVKINYSSNIKFNFTGAFEHNNINNALESITHPLNLTYLIKKFGNT